MVKKEGFDEKAQLYLQKLFVLFLEDYFIVVLSKNDFYAVQSEQFVDETFEGSLPAFIAAFTQRKGISQQEAAEIRRMIDAAAGKE